jgi:hypothetical protein
MRQRSPPGSRSRSLAKPITGDRALAPRSESGNTRAGGFRLERRYTAQRAFNFCMTTERRAATRRFAFRTGHHGGPLGRWPARPRLRAATTPLGRSGQPVRRATGPGLRGSTGSPGPAADQAATRGDRENGSVACGSLRTGCILGRFAPKMGGRGATKWLLRGRKLRPRCAKPKREPRRELRSPCKSIRAL